MSAKAERQTEEPEKTKTLQQEKRGTPKQKKKNSLLGILFLDLIILVLFIATTEGILRYFQPQIKQFIYTENITGGHPVEYNQYGLRDTNFPLQKPEDERRILVLGNSTTFGSGVTMEDTYPKRLQDRLKGAWFVINAGGQGASLPEAIDFLTAQGLKMQPDIVILGFSPAMIAKAKIAAPGANEKNISLNTKLQRKGRETLLAVHKALHASYAYAATDHYIRKGLYRAGILKDDLTQRKGSIYAYAFDVPEVSLEEVNADYERFYRELSTLKQILDTQNTPLIMTGFPSRFESTNMPDSNPRNLPLEKIRVSPLEKAKYAAGIIQIPYIDMSDTLSSEEGAFIESDYTHLSKKGHKLVAQELYKNLQQSGGQ